MSSHPIRCRCGKLQGEISHAELGTRAVCYCHDCQAFAHFLGAAEEYFDPLGGTEIVAIAPTMCFLHCRYRAPGVHVSHGAGPCPLVRQLLSHSDRQYAARPKALTRGGSYMPACEPQEARSQTPSAQSRCESTDKARRLARRLSRSLHSCLRAFASLARSRGLASVESTSRTRFSMRRRDDRACPRAC